MNFILGLTRLKWGRDSIFVVVNRFSKIKYFIRCHKTKDVTDINDLLYRKIVRVYEVPRKFCF